MASSKDDGGMRATDMTMDSVHQQSELLVMDYLRGSRCMKTMDALSRWISDKAKKTNKSGNASEIYNKDAAARKDSSGIKSSSVLEYMIGKRKQSKAHRMSCVSPDVATGVSIVPIAKPWSAEDIALLKKAAKSTQSITDKTERWKNVGAVLGRSKRECYDKYKEIKKERKTKTDPPTPKADSSTPRSKGSKAATPKGKRSTAPAPNDDMDSSQSWGSRKASPSVAPDCRAASKYEAVIEDCDDLDDTFDAAVPAKQAVARAPSTANGRAVGSAEMASIRQLLFGAAKKSLTPHWTAQGFPFASAPGYGIVQHEGGPCGVMAVVQAYMLRSLFSNAPGSWQNPTPDQLSRALVDALAHIIWQAGDDKGCCVALQGAQRTMDQVRVSTLASRAAARDFIERNAAEFAEARGFGVVLLVLSVLLTRGPATVAADMDAPDGATPTLIGAHDYCTQEIVNLLLVGYACSNVFDGTQDLGDGLVLRGIAHQGPVGFLTLFEAYEYMVVGDHLKTPATPIWVVCSESHYSTLFADPDAPAAVPVELLYYDGLANQDEPIRLSVDPAGLAAPEKPDAHALTPPLDLVIRTKWPRATVDWNGTDPLL
ncbi:hypothetical protein ACHHYP_02052 [Achlya hypogyna]|uniref:Myb-like domain-containing protein n=1 Tax=Achlya hypogyna TaxID=1202772 RepID=A0A1V9ZSF2_ACHHY|nr:hypothetical protein ACHHYP_02052 [Achlya hypogyna]